MLTRIPRIKFGQKPAKSIIPIYSPEAIEQQQRDRARQQEIRDRNVAEIEESRTVRAAQSTRQTAIDAISGQSTRH